MKQRHRLAAQAVDDVPVVDHLDATSIARCAPARQAQHPALTEEALQPIIVDPQLQPIADQAGRHGVEDFAQDEAAAGGHQYGGLVMVGGTPRRQRAKLGALEFDELVAPCVAATDEVGDPVAIGVEAVEVGAAAQHQCLGDGALKVAVLALDRAILVRHAEVVAGRLHAIMGTQGLVAPGLILSGIAVEITERGREAVGAMLGRGAAERPQGVLQATGQGREALAAQHRLGMLPAGIGQDEVIQPVGERLTGEMDAKIGHVGEVRQALPARRVILAEDHLVLRPVLRAPSANAAL
jgi:hypothetical protein